MMATSTFILVLASIISTVFGYPIDCDKGPSFWCLSPKIAKRCGVLEFCEVAKAKDVVKEKSVLPDAPPVNVSLYYESLCPDCRDVFKDQVFPTFHKLRNTGVLNLALYPYGNAREFKTPHGWHFQCQHGKTECDVNIIETCALHLLHVHGSNRLHKFLSCVETGDVYPTIHWAKKCANDLGIEWDPIFHCFNGSQGNYLEHQVAEQTEKLNPPHTYVPWFTVEGVHTKTIQDKLTDDMLGYVCNAYTGTKPDVCHKNREPEHKRKPIGACYKDFK